MTWIALLLVGLGLVDLAYSIAATRRIDWLPEAAGAAGVVLLALLGSLDGGDIAAWLVVAGVVVAWGQLAHRRLGGHPARALALLAVALALGVLLSPLAGDYHGVAGRWLDHTPWGWMSGADPSAALLVLGGLLVQLSTGNVVVRLVLEVTGSVNPAPGHDASTRLKGGRLLGPMERLVILGLGLAGQVTAASLVIAAKGLVRWPELQSFRQAEEGPSINEVTEYFLVGSFVSWLVSLGTLVIVTT